MKESMTRLTDVVRMIWTAAILLGIGVVACIGQAASASKEGVIRGTWTLKSVYSTPNVQGPDAMQQRKLLRSKIVIDATSINSCGQSAKITSTEVKNVSADEFLADNLVPLDSVGIHGPSVTQVVLNQRQSGTCLGAFPMPGLDIYIKGRDELVIAFEGVFYRAVRDKADCH
jgi:hypothetical protein